MTASITIGLWLLGAAVGSTLGWLVMRRVAVGRAARIGVVVAIALIVTSLLHFTITPTLIDAWATRRARDQLLALPVYPLLRDHEPAVFDALAHEYAQVLSDPSRGARYADFMNAEISAVATRRIARASDDALLALMHDMLEKLQMLRAKSPDDCYRYLFPQVAGPPKVARYFDAAAQRRTLDLMADVIRTSAERPSPLPPPDRVKDLMAPIVNGMYAQFGADTAVLSRAEEPGVNRKAVCAVSVALYEKVLQLPPADAAAVIRSMTQL